jgi:hypothetical protein
VGAHPLPPGRDGFGQVLPTPAALDPRRLPTADLLPPPPDDRFAATVSPLPAVVLARSTWQPACPVPVAGLRYLTLAFWGFDGHPHTGEMIVAASIADQVVAAFHRLHDRRFPIEEMRVVAAAELTAAPTGDGNNTTAFVCRPARGQTRWSAHALGLAIDLDPFCNPARSPTVIPELASAYLDRGRVRPGMVLAGGPEVAAFAAAGLSWGGAWRSSPDLMHFTANGS